MISEWNVFSHINNYVNKTLNEIQVQYQDNYWMAVCFFLNMAFLECWMKHHTTSYSVLQCLTVVECRECRGKINLWEGHWWRDVFNHWRATKDNSLKGVSCCFQIVYWHCFSKLKDGMRQRMRQLSHGILECNSCVEIDLPLSWT